MCTAAMETALRRIFTAATRPCVANVAFECRRGFAAKRRIDGYLHYYGKLKNQEGMLRDKARVEGYKLGIEAARSKIEGKTVMDIGTGSGILAMFAARCGAKKVYAIEASPEMARVASRLIRANGFTGVIELVPKHLEEVSEDEIPKGSVDVIVSELFSHFLVGEIGLQVVTMAKERFLRPGGLILPEIAWLKISPFEDKALATELRSRHRFWNNRDFYGFDLTGVLAIAEEQTVQENICDIVHPSELLVPPSEAPGKEINMATPDDPKIWNKISFEVEFPKRSKDAVIDGICGWWDVIFSGGGGDTAPVLSTAPDAPPTVWAQNRFLLDRPLAAKADEKLTAKVEMKTHAERESYTVWIHLKNEVTRESSRAGPINLSNVYARHFAQPKSHSFEGEESYRPEKPLSLT